MILALMSRAAPGGNPTTMRTGRDGYFSALAIRDAAGNATATAARCRNRRRANAMAFPNNNGDHNRIEVIPHIVMRK